MPENSLLGSDEPVLIPPTSEEKTLALLSHLLTFIFPILAPLLIWLVKKDESTFVAYHAKESLNFQITLFIVCIVLIVTIVGLLLLWIVGLVAVVLVIVATIKAADGKLYRYPLSIRLIK